MPEYLAPGVYIEESSIRSVTVEGVPTSTAGFAGMTRFGPVHYPGGPSSSEPRLVTSFTEFERLYGGLEALRLSGGDTRTGYLAYAARAFFLNGGQRLYVSRVFQPVDSETNTGVASRTIAFGSIQAAWRARWPGQFGNVRVDARLVRRGNVAFAADRSGATVVQVNQIGAGAVVEVTAGGEPPADDAPLNLDDLRAIAVDAAGHQTFVDSNGNAVEPSLDALILPIELNVTVVDQERTDSYAGLAFHPDQQRYIGRILDRESPADRSAVVCLDWDPTSLGSSSTARLAASLHLAAALQASSGQQLEGGNDGVLISPATMLGSKATATDPTSITTGLEALGMIPEIAIVSAPDAPTLASDNDVAVATGHLIRHAGDLRYRFAILDGPPGFSIEEIRAFRARFDSEYAALYYPWLITPAETGTEAGEATQSLILPPSGTIAGIYARNDVQLGVHKAPANEIILGIAGLETTVDRAGQELLNPEGINALRFFEGRGHRVWGARTISSDPEWKYVNVRRLFIFLERSIEKGTQWAVFETNGERLWAAVRRTIEDFLIGQWRSGALLGQKPEEAFFVRCDRSTMTQNDLENGQLICLIGVAPVRPAEFMIFRIAQRTGVMESSSADEAPTDALTKNPFVGFDFLVVLGDDRDDGFEDTVIGGFSVVSGLGADFDATDYRETKKLPDNVRRLPRTRKFDQVTLERGVMKVDDLQKWLRDVRDSTGDSRRVTIVRLDEGRNPVTTWALHNAQLKRWTGPELVAKGGTDVAIEELTLVYEGLEMS